MRSPRPFKVQSFCVRPAVTDRRSSGTNPFRLRSLRLLLLHSENYQTNPMPWRGCRFLYIFGRKKCELVIRRCKFCETKPIHRRRREFTKRTHRSERSSVPGSANSASPREKENYETNPTCLGSQISGFEISDCPGRRSQTGRYSLLRNEPIPTFLLSVCFC